MDPISALGAAAAVTQFVDYTIIILKDTREIIKSVKGQTAKNIELSLISTDLKRLIEDVDNKSLSLATNETDLSEDVFLRLCGECREIADQLLASCARLQATGVTRLDTVASSFVVAVKGVWKSGKLEDLRQRLDQVRQQMMMATLTFLWGAARKQETTMSQFAQIQADATKNINKIHKSILKFNEEMLDLVRGRTQAGQIQGPTMADYIAKCKWDPTGIIEDITRPEKRLNQEHIQRIMDSLPFEAINNRERAVAEAYPRTNDWIFYEPRRLENGHEVWHSFPQWLEGPSHEIYWITGKPGAGKSTLVKYILADPRLKSALMKWSQQRLLIVAAYFSWNAGTDLQNSHAGLIRTLLYQCLQSQPGIVPRVFPRKWAALSLFPLGQLPEWDEEELFDAFKNLVFEHGKSYNFAFIIDGLDEFKDNHQRLIDLLQLVNRQENVKICASSRPWNSFRDAFAQSPKLQIEHLTKEDIDFYVRHHFAKSQGFRELNAIYPSEAGELLPEIVEKSKGVFLWVSVVVGMLLNDLREGDKFADLRKTLFSLPDDMEQLFDHILASVDFKYHSESSRLFQMMTAAEEVNMIVYGLTVFFADDDVSVNLEIEEEPGSFLTNALAVVERRLSSRTRGILEVHRPEAGKSDHFARVEYLHRTAKEWFTSRSVEIRAMDSDFDPFLSLLKGEVFRMAADKFALQLAINESAAPLRSGRSKFWIQIKLVLKCAIMVGNIPRNHDSIVQLLERFDRHISAIWETKDEDGKYLLTPIRTPHIPQGPDIPGPDPPIHWCSSTDLKAVFPFNAVIGPGFLRCMAQLPVPAYITAKAHKTPGIVTIDILRDIAFTHISYLNGYSVIQAIYPHPHARKQDATVRLNLLHKLLSHDHTGAISECLLNDCDSLMVPQPEGFEVYFETLKGKFQASARAKRGKKRRVSRYLRKLRQYFRR